MLLVYLKRRCYPLFSSKFLIGQLYSNWPGSSSRTVIYFLSILHKASVADSLNRQYFVTRAGFVYIKAAFLWGDLDQDQ